MENLCEGRLAVLVSTGENVGAVVECSGPVGMGDAMSSYWRCAEVVHCSAERWKEVDWAGRFECSRCLEKSPRQSKMSAVHQLCTGAAQVLLKGSADPQHDYLKLLCPVRVVSETGHEGSFHGAMESLHDAIGLRII